jgi:hypothetical protein
MVLLLIWLTGSRSLVGRLFSFPGGRGEEEREGRALRRQRLERGQFGREDGDDELCSKLTLFPECLFV